MYYVSTSSQCAQCIVIINKVVVVKSVMKPVVIMVISIEQYQRGKKSVRWLSNI